MKNEWKNYHDNVTEQRSLLKTTQDAKYQLNITNSKFLYLKLILYKKMDDKGGLGNI